MLADYNLKTFVTELMEEQFLYSYQVFLIWNISAMGQSHWYPPGVLSRGLSCQAVQHYIR